MKTIFHPFNAAKEFATVERCFITEIENDAENPELSVARARVEPGETTAWHKLTRTTERYLMISGTGLMEVEGVEPVDVTCGDVVCIPAGKSQRIINTGNEDLVFFAVCTPRFTPECYIGLE